MVRMPWSNGGRRERGAAAVEFALVAPLLLILLLGIIEFGFVFNNQISLNQAVREGVRVEALETGSGDEVTRASFLGVTGSGGDLGVSVSGCDGDAERATVSATYPHQLVVLPGGLLSIGNPTLTGEATMRCGG